MSCVGVIGEGCNVSVIGKGYIVSCVVCDW